MERNVSDAIVDAWAKEGRRGVVLNDGTRSDVLLFGDGESECGTPVQVKTTAGGRSSVKFSAVTGYEGMPVLFWRCDVGRGWLCSGDALNERNINDLTLTPGGPNESQYALAANLGLEELLEFIAKHQDRWALVSEDAARHGFASEKTALEMAGMDRYKKKFARDDYQFPGEQQGSVDLLEGDSRLQFKTVQIRKYGSGRVGFEVAARTSAGVREGKPEFLPYPLNSFDFLVAVAVFENDFFFWKIPSAVLERYNFFGLGGHVSLTLYSPVIGTPPAHNSTNSWTKKYFLE